MNTSDIMLKGARAQRLYHEVAATLPILDFHNHLDAGQIEANLPFENSAQLWLLSDPYKHRAMRMAGVPECDITGGTGDREKFNIWARTLPRTLGQPLYHWCALELAFFSGSGAASCGECGSDLGALPGTTPRLDAPSHPGVGPGGRSLHLEPDGGGPRRT
ncbi:MAG: glucuronate isomerase [Blastochloris sp.]|nr:glucuronate isomerase [Blastochloris sp.]